MATLSCVAASSAWAKASTGPFIAARPAAPPAIILAPAICMDWPARATPSRRRRTPSSPADNWSRRARMTCSFMSAMGAYSSGAVADA
ncbi:MAG: hypothetical protein IPN92_06930 [Chromatiaceae bacterium]|nr:hypothetical protein [Chromatiaceae bacterium]